MDLLNPKDELNIQHAAPPTEATPRQDVAARSLEATAQALQAVSSQPTEGMNPTVKAAQRADLMQRVPSSVPVSSAVPAPVPTPVVTSVPPSQTTPTPPVKQTPPEKRPHPWFLFAGGFATVGLVIALAIFVIPGLRRTSPAGSLSTQGVVSLLTIPEAHAGDAFSLYANLSDAGGMNTTSGFTLKSTVPVDASVLQQVLRIVPPVPVTVESLPDQTYRVQPTSPLDSGTVYRVSLAASVAKTDGATFAREFSWAFQTKNDFHVLSTIPADVSASVPVDTGIEFKMTRDGWVDATSSFQILPAVPGRFEAHGRTLAFVPSQKLAYGTTYQVTLKKGFHLAGSDLALAKDQVIRFETQAKSNLDQANEKPRLELSEFYESIPGQELDLPVYLYDRANAFSSVELIGYKLTDVEAKTLLQARLSLPAWRPAERNRYAAYQSLAQKTAAFTATTTLRQTDGYGQYSLPVPKQDAPGFWAIKVTPGNGGLVTWFFLQVTNTATYQIADKNALIVWAVDASTKRPLSNLPMQDEDGTTQTDAQGIAHLPSPAFLTATSTDATATTPFRLIEMGTGVQKAFAGISGANALSIFDFSINARFVNTWGYLYPDRPIYHPSDELKFFGLAQDRDSHQGVGQVSVRLQKESYLFDFGTGASKSYQSADITTDAAGRFQGSFRWNDLAPGYYRVALYRDDAIVTSRYFEVREFVKPSYSITIRPDADRVFAGTPMTGTIVTTFYDGTPVPRASLSFTAQQGGRPMDPRTITTDENGRATFNVPTRLSDCLTSSDGYCSPFESLLLDVHAETAGATATIVAKASHVDLSKDQVAGENWSGAKLHGKASEVRWEPIPDGTYYDYVQKKVVPRFRYERRVEPPVPFELTTDATGRATYSFVMKPDRSYDLVVEGADELGRGVRNRLSVAPGWYEIPGTYSGGGSDQTPRLQYVPTNDSGEFDLNAPVNVRYQLGKEPLDTTRNSGVLYVIASRGIKQVAYSDRADFSFAYSDALAPNAEIRGVAFLRNRFQVVQISATQKRDPQRLTIETTGDQTLYAPGSNVKIHAIVKAKDGARVGKTKIAFAAIDNALSAVTFLAEEDPIGPIYGYVSDGVLFQNASHSERPGFFGGGAEKGGGGMGDIAAQSVRKIFKDTAAFGVVETDDNGEADFTFTAPDNLTTWRVEAVGISSDLKAGSQRINIPVTKPVFVEVVAPPRLLATDKPVLKLRAFGSALPAHTPVTYTVDAPSLGLTNATVTGTSDVSTYVSVDTLPVGHHTLTIRVTTPNGTDALERTLDVVSSRFLKDEYVSVDAIPGASLPELGQPEADVSLMSKARASLLPETQSLAWNDSARVDAKLAVLVANGLLSNQFGQTPEDAKGTSLAAYQDYLGGIKLLPYASPDVELSAEVAATMPEAFDRTLLASYFWQQLDAAKGSREVQIQSIAGLAALGEPVLPQLQALAEQKDLTWREQLAIGRALVASGDLERARGILEALLAKGEERDATLRLNVSNNVSEQYEATADAAALAASLAHPKAAALRAFVDSNWSHDAFPVLAEARYLSAVLPTLPVSPTVVTWTLDGNTQESFAFKEEPAKTLTLTAAEARAFRVTQVTGPVAITFVRRTPGKPTSVPEVSVARSYRTIRPLNAMFEGDTVLVTVTSTWQAKAQDGCYHLRDHLPGGWQAVLNWSSYQGQPFGLPYPYDVSNGEVSFIVCKDVKPVALTYLARVVSRGSYTAEAPLLQQMEYPSVAAVGADQLITIK